MATNTSTNASFGLFGPLPTAPATRILRSSIAAEPALGGQLEVIREREGDDAGLTGGTRSLHRRLLALNLGSSHRFHPASITDAITQPISA